MYISECKHGAIVNNSQGTRIGMIIGITNNCADSDSVERSKPENVVALVQWSCGAVYPVNPSNLKLCKY